MIYSMTGFAVAQHDTAAGTLMVEMRSVNHRYLELHLRLDDALRAFEPQVREAISCRLGRGKVEFRASLVAPSGEPAQAELSTNTLEQLAQLSASVQQRFPQSQPLSVADILRWPGVLVTEQIPVDVLHTDLLVVVERVISELTASRAREGEKLAAIILERVAQMEALVIKIRPLLPALLQAYQEKLASRLH